MLFFRAQSTKAYSLVVAIQFLYVHTDATTTNIVARNATLMCCCLQGDCTMRVSDPSFGSSITCVAGVEREGKGGIGRAKVEGDARPTFIIFVLDKTAGSGCRHFIYFWQERIFLPRIVLT